MSEKCHRPCYRLTFDELITGIALSYESRDDLDEPLTSAHLLIGRCLTGLPDLLTRTSNEDTEHTAPTSSADITRQVKHLNVILSHQFREALETRIPS